MRTFILLSVAGLISRSALAQFTPEQSAAFTQGAGASGEALLLLISAITAVLVFAGFGWISYAAFQAWKEGQLSTAGVMGLLIRASVLLIIFGLFIR